MFFNQDNRRDPLYVFEVLDVDFVLDEVLTFRICFVHP